MSKGCTAEWSAQHNAVDVSLSPSHASMDKAVCSTKAFKHGYHFLCRAQCHGW